ncbi:unnamed protein product [Rotaria magnacalcarata]|uniref:Helix-turn-helix domain-containing protein n=2 Tax=Rotaria magnacalcarata TaxID=392030 RepID=A0A820CG48_9BILA|nr:unnamed protein product [Rotaria magnacalcarata]CAF4221460.1 unnamed protein product [Rotaria magnacalcarata]
MEKQIVEEQTKTDEFYGRYIDDIFMTWNRSEEELRKLLDDLNTWHPNIKLDYKIGNSLPFLDAQLTNNNGILSTSVYHKPSAEPYVTPFISDHPRHVFSNIIKTSIERAIRYSSTFEAFNYERRYIKLMLLYNDCPSTFIENELHKYFSEYISKSPFLSLINDEQKYFLLRKQILGKPTPRQTQVAMSAAMADIDNDPLDDDERQQPDTCKRKSEETISNCNETFFNHFTYEKRFETCKRDIHRVYNHAFKDTPAMYTKKIVGNRNRRSTQNELIHKRPNKTFLRSTTITKRIICQLMRPLSKSCCQTLNIETLNGNSTIFHQLILEHQYASTYLPFTPLPHTLHYINRTTSEETLNQINQTVTTSFNFTLDTESIQTRQRKNKPVLIQIQVLLSNNFSIILIFEMCHLPREHTTTFYLIKNLLTTIFNSSKPIYIWSERDELTTFVIYNLFSATQISLTNFQNLLDKFKEQWQQQHSHITSNISSSDLTPECVCEKCIGKSSHELWSLQNAVSYELNEWLDKRSTKSHFNIGLDPQLSQLNLKEQQDRQKLTSYAANDCLSMQRLLIKMQIITIAPTTTTSNIHPSNINPGNIKLISSDDTQCESESESEPEEQRSTTSISNSITTITASIYDHDLELISSDEDEHHLPQQSQRTVTFNKQLSILEPKQNEQLSNEERKKNS